MSYDGLAIKSTIVVVTDELKDAVVALMMRKDEVEEQMKFAFYCYFRRYIFTFQDTVMIY